MSIFEAEPNEHIEKIAEELKKVPEIKAPTWASIVKTGVHKERQPARADWWQIRAAAVLRSVARLGPVGVSKIRTKYGGKHSRGHKAEEFAKGSGSIARKILQQLESAGLLKQVEKGAHKGRVLTPKGQSLLTKTAMKVAGKNTKK